MRRFRDGSQGGCTARVLTAGGRAVFSVYHPAMAEAGKEAHFAQGEIEYRLGARRHSLDDYRGAFEQARFANVMVSEHLGDDDLAVSVSGAEKYLGFPVLVVFAMEKEPPGSDTARSARCLVSERG